MRKRNRNKKRLAEVATTVNQGETYVEMPSPFEGLSEQDLQRVYKAIGDEQEQLFREGMVELLDRCLDLDPVSLLSYFAFYDLSMFIDRISERPPDAVSQSDIEFVQSLILRHHIGEYRNEYVGPQFEVIRKTLRQVTNASRMRQFAKVVDLTSSTERQLMRVQEQIRGDTQQLRNWGYPQQIAHVVKGLFHEVDDDIERKLGVRIEYLVTMCFNIIDLVEERANEHIRKMTEVNRERNVSAIISTYCQNFPEPEVSPKDWESALRESGLTRKQTIAILLHRSDLWLPHIYEVSLEDFCRSYPSDIAPSILEAVLDRWSLAFGELVGGNPEAYLLDNPVWRKPIIKTGPSEYFIPLIALFVSFCLELMEDVARQDEHAFAGYMSGRGEYLENSLGDLFKVAFPSAIILRGSKWSDPKTNRGYENDLLVLIDSYLFIIEAKSGKITAPARRGAPDRLKRTIEDLMIKPSDQSRRFAEYLQENLGRHRFVTRYNGVNEIDLSIMSPEVCKSVRH